MVENTLERPAIRLGASTLQGCFSSPSSFLGCGKGGWWCLWIYEGGVDGWWLWQRVVVWSGMAENGGKAAAEVENSV